MTRRSLLLAALTVALAYTSPVYGQRFYDIDTINTIEITFEEANWDQLLDNLYAAGDEERLVATARINGVVFDSVGVRYKGNSTYQANQIKNPFNIKLDHIIDDQELEGYGTLKLANVTNDPSFVREVLSYEIARQFMPASQANFANVYVNGELLGLYTSVQSVDKHFMGMHFSSDENARFKGELAQDGRPTLEEVWNYRGADSTAYYAYYELQSDTGWQALIDFLETFNNDPANLETVLNLDRHLWMLAFDILMVNLDAPVNFAHNYYLYQDEAGRFNPIVWDLNENFGVFTSLLDGGNLSTAQMQQMDPFLNATNPNFPIVNKVLSNPTYKKMYVAHMKTMMEEIFASGWYENRALEIQQMIDTDVQADPNKFYTYANFLGNITTTIGSGRPGPGSRSIVGLTELMEARVDYLNAQAEFQATAPTISAVAHAPEAAPRYSDAVVTADVRDATSVVLAYRHSATDAFTKIEMFDDGAHQDGLANDGVYGVSIGVEASEMQYYVYAENNDAAQFAPARAAYEFYTLSVATGDVVINEFMADNDTYVADQDGDFDDWIELYNTTDAPVSLAGYHLSDDGADLAQWVFPDTTIAANGYLIVWADNDDEQGGLHANFALSSNGESIYLSEPDTTVLVDQVSFGAQTTDLSTGRTPNGTGRFAQMPPSFAVENAGIQTGLEEDSRTDLPEGFTLEQNYPNPFNPHTSIRFTLPQAGHAWLAVYDVLGREVAVLVDASLAAGQHEAVFDASALSSGLYLYRMTASGQTFTRTMMLVK